MNWDYFLQAYKALRKEKGSYHHLSKAVNELAKEYRGNWE